MALGSIASGPLFHHLEQHHKKVKEIVLCLDNDSSGILGRAKILKAMAEKYPEIKVTMQFPKGKDFNADLTNQKTEGFVTEAGDGNYIPKHNPKNPSGTVNFFINGEDLVYRLAEGLHLEQELGRPLPTYLLMSNSNEIEIMAKHLKERKEAGTPIHKMNFYIRQGVFNEDLKTEINCLRDKAEQKDIPTQIYNIHPLDNEGRLWSIVSRRNSKKDLENIRREEDYVDGKPHFKAVLAEAKGEQIARHEIKRAAKEASKGEHRK